MIEAGDVVAILVLALAALVVVVEWPGRRP